MHIKMNIVRAKDFKGSPFKYGQPLVISDDNTEQLLERLTNMLAWLRQQNSDSTVIWNNDHEGSVYLWFEDKRLQLMFSIVAI